MKKLIVTVKSPAESLGEFKEALKTARKVGRGAKAKGSHYEIAFDRKKDFDRFVKNLGILAVILNHRPRSVYELAKLVDMDVSNLNKLILFFAAVGAVRIRTSKVDGRTVKTPVVEYDHVEFDLKRVG